MVDTSSLTNATALEQLKAAAYYRATLRTTMDGIMLAHRDIKRLQEARRIMVEHNVQRDATTTMLHVRRNDLRTLIAWAKHDRRAMQKALNLAMDAMA